jgi:hypothetical protein
VIPILQPFAIFNSRLWSKATHHPVLSSWLLVDDRWKQSGTFADVNAFIDSIRLDKFRQVAEARKRIAARIKALQPKVSNRRIAATLGVDPETVRRDLGAANAAKPSGELRKTNGSANAGAANAVTLTGAAAAQAVKQAAVRQTKAETKARNRQERQMAVAKIWQRSPACRFPPSPRTDPSGRLATRSAVLICRSDSFAA